ncbi:hypothetical protein Tco_1180893 [Tanacetum coccineum]
MLVKEAEAAEAIRLRAEVPALADRNTVLEGEKNDLDVKVADLAVTVKVREQEVADLDGVVTSVKVSSAGLQEKVTAYENFIGQLEKFQDDRMREMEENFDKLDTDLVELVLHLEERFYPHLLTTISGRRWLLTHGLELAITKCLNSTEYLSSLGAAIGKAVEKELKSNKEAGIDTIMNLLRLKDSLTGRLGLTESCLQFPVRGSCFPSRPLNLYAPFPSASVTSYGPSYFGPSFPVSSARLASLLRYTKSPGLKLMLRVTPPNLGRSGMLNIRGRYFIVQ